MLQNRFSLVLLVHGEIHGYEEKVYLMDYFQSREGKGKKRPCT